MKLYAAKNNRVGLFRTNKSTTPKQKNLSRTEILTMIKRMTSSGMVHKHRVNRTNAAQNIKERETFIYNPFFEIPATGTDATTEFGRVGNDIWCQNLIMKMSITIAVTASCAVRVVGFWAEEELAAASGNATSYLYSTTNWDRLPFDFPPALNSSGTFTQSPFDRDRGDLVFDTTYTFNPLQTGASSCNARTINKTISMKNKKLTYRSPGNSYFEKKNFYIAVLAGAVGYNQYVNETTTICGITNTFSVNYKQ